MRYMSVTYTNVDTLYFPYLSNPSMSSYYPGPGLKRIVDINSNIKDELDKEMLTCINSFGSHCIFLS